MPHGDVETYHENGQWKNRHEGTERAFGTYETREEAVAAGKEAAKEAGVEHIVHNMDGTIGERSTYGHDPRDIPG